ncbi:hypothetical protein ACPEID_31350, partial [Bacillus bombysepticus]
ILTTSESVWRIQLKMYIFIQALMYIFKLAFIEKVSCILYAYDFSVTLRFEKTRDLEFHIGNLIHS